MVCKACNKTLSESEEKINEWGFLEVMCSECIAIGRDANFDSEQYGISLYRNLNIEYDLTIPGWAVCVKEIDGYSIAFEREPIFDEGKQTWLANGGRAELIGSPEDELEEEEV